MSFVVTTPTGKIGSRIVQLLIQAGVRPTVLVRDPARLPEEVRAASVVRQGDLNDRAFVLKATEGAEALFWLTPEDYHSEDPVGDMVRLGQHAAEAVQTNGITRTVFLSSEGAGKRDDSLIGALGKTEDLLNATGANVLHLRPGYFFTNLLMSVAELRQGVLATTALLDMAMPWNDPRDVGDIAAARLLSGGWTGQAVQAIHGPANLTFAQVATIVSGAVGRQIEAIRISDDQLREGLQKTGMSGAVVEAFVQMMRHLGEGAASDYVRDFVTTTPTKLEGWCYAHLRPVLLGGDV